MKTLIWIAAGIMITALSLPAQQGRGGKPLAWSDADKDGICDVTNQPVGQNIGQGRRAGTAANGQGMGQGRGGAPFAWNDANKDGICDVTGQPVGQVIGRGRGGRGRMMMMQNLATPGATGTAAPNAFWGRGRGGRSGAFWGQGGRGFRMERWMAVPQAQATTATSQPDSDSAK